MIENHHETDLWLWGGHEQSSNSIDIRKHLNCLSQEELGRLNRMTSDHLRSQFLTTRILLKNLLIKKYQKSINIYRKTISFPKFEEVFFSISHSGSLIGMVATRLGTIGLDVEIKPSSNGSIDRIDKMMNRFFSKEENKNFHQLSSPKKKIDYFYRHWTLKEAYYKFIFPTDRKLKRPNFFKLLQQPPYEIISKINWEQRHHLDQSPEYYLSIVYEKKLSHLKISSRFVLESELKNFLPPL